MKWVVRVAVQGKGQEMFWCAPIQDFHPHETAPRGTTAFLNGLRPLNVTWNVYYSERVRTRRQRWWRGVTRFAEEVLVTIAILVTP